MAMVDWEACLHLYGSKRNFAPYQITAILILGYVESVESKKVFQDAICEQIDSAVLELHALKKRVSDELEQRNLEIERMKTTFAMEKEKFSNSLKVLFLVPTIMQKSFGAGCIGAGAN
jgi:hypothetical protein